MSLVFNKNNNVLTVEALFYIGEEFYNNNNNDLYCNNSKHTSNTVS